MAIITQELPNLFEEYMDIQYQTFELSINANLPQRFTHRFVNGRIIVVYIRYNKPFQNWIIDFYEQGEVETPIVLGVELHYGLDLLSSFKYKDIGEFYVFPLNPREFDSPTADDLNTNFVYVWRHN